MQNDGNVLWMPGEWLVEEHREGYYCVHGDKSEKQKPQKL